MSDPSRATAPSRTLVFETMGTVVSVTSPTEIDPVTGEAVRTKFAELDAQFSLYRSDSEGSAVARDLTKLKTASSSFRETYDLAIAWRDATEGAFTPHRPDGKVDLSGVVKALGIQRAGEVLSAAGYRDWCLNAGGDVLVSGTSAGTPWVVGVVDPDDRTALWTSYTTTPERRAVATSGIQERGEHVWRMAADDTFVQVTVAAADIITADVLATAILAGGIGTLEHVQKSFEIDVLAGTADGRVWASPVFLS